MAAAEPPGALIGAGRAADVYAIGPGRVLRRYRAARDVQAEAELMIYLGQAGYPVPAVYDASGTDLVMERLDGRDMLADLASGPWRARRHGRLLAQLHNRLHQIPAPAGLRPAFAPGDKVLHLDFHPGNVMLTGRGPVVIDWSNVRAGVAGADVAMAYLIMASSQVDQVPPQVRPLVRSVRAALIGRFRRSATDDPEPHLAAAARERLRDPNVRPSEAAWMLRLVDQLERQSAERGVANT
jgi:aminoglycoside phosphotransferase (APT) family kinase protein